MSKFTQKPHLVCIGGFSGSGKSTVAQELARQLAGEGADVLLLRSDVVHKKMYGLAETERLPETAYEWDNLKKMIAEMNRLTLEALAEGRTVIADSTFAGEDGRDRHEEMAHEARSLFTGIWIDVPPDEMRRRVAARTNDASDAGIDVLNDQIERGPGDIRWKRVDGNRATSEVVKDVRAELENASVPPAPQPRNPPAPKTGRQG